MYIKERKKNGFRNSICFNYKFHLFALKIKSWLISLKTQAKLLFYQNICSTLIFKPIKLWWDIPDIREKKMSLDSHNAHFLTLQHNQEKIFAKDEWCLQIFKYNFIYTKVIKRKPILCKMTPMWWEKNLYALLHQMGVRKSQISPC